MKQIAIAQHNHNNDYNALASNICDVNGKPLLSWRVKLLPYLQHDDLYKKFKQDEPWDSSHNFALLKDMPTVFSINIEVPKDYCTPFRAFVGNGAVLENGKKIRFTDIKDGTSNTLMFVEAAEAVPWTKPDDLLFDPNKPLPKLGGRFDNVFLGCLCDGAARAFPTAMKPETLKKLITRAGGENIDWQELEVKQSKPSGR